MSRKPRSYTRRIQDAVDESDLSMATKALLRVMAHHADHRTGVGRSGQERLAKYVGCTDRLVRTIMAELESPGATPVRLERRARFYSDGRGRTSDEWRLILVDQPDRASGYSPSINRNELPLSPPRLTGNLRTTNQKSTHDQPERTSGDPHSDPHSDPHRNTASVPETVSFALAAHPSKAPKPKPRSPAKAKADATNGEAHRRVVEAYFAGFRAKHGKDPIFDGADGSAVKRLLEKLKGDPAEACRRIRIAFASWRGGSVTIRDIASKPDAFASEPNQRRQVTGPQNGGLDPALLARAAL